MAYEQGAKMLYWQVILISKWLQFVGLVTLELVSQHGQGQMSLCFQHAVARAQSQKGN